MSEPPESDALRVGWLTTPWIGRVGLTIAPGKVNPDGPVRSLGADLTRLRDDHGASHLVCLLEDDELPMLGIDALPQAAVEAGMAFHRLPIRDGATPRERDDVTRLVAAITGWAATGENVVIHCRGGLGRSGTIGGCVLRAAGMDGHAALAELAVARGPSCPETPEQRRYIREFVPGGAAARSRVLGAVLGAAIGDALGHPTEFLSIDRIRARYGRAGVTGFELFWERDGGRFAPYTDDTQMAEIVLRSLVAARRANAPMDAAMGEIASGFAAWAEAPQGGHRAPGGACMRGAQRLAAGVPWREAGGANDGGCGSVMRAYPFGLLAGDLALAERWAVEHSRMTHRDPIALAACAAMAVGVALELRREAPTAVLAAMVEAAGRWDSGTARMAERAVARGQNGADPDAVLRELEGWAAHEAIAAAMFVVARHPHDIRGALLEGANASGDSDSIATLAGALLGARLGLEALPAAWVRHVERASELLALGREAADLVAR